MQKGKVPKGMRLAEKEKTRQEAAASLIKVDNLLPTHEEKHHVQHAATSSDGGHQDQL